MSQIREAARGRWRSILPAMGIGEAFLTDKHGPCPLCEGRDRFRFDDKDGDGTWFCTHCGAGHGTKLVMLKQGLDFAHAAAEISKHVNGAPIVIVKEGRTPTQKRELLRRTWSDARPVSLDDVAGQYLHRRCELTTYPKALRFAPKLLYRDETQSSFFPGLLAQVSDAEGEPVNIHRTFLDDDAWKAPVGDPRRTMEGPLPPGCAIRLTPPAAALGIAEGIETAISCRKLFGIGTWASISAQGMVKWTPPPGCSEVWIFGDNDETFVGQAAAYALAQRLHHEGYAVTVRIPEGEDTHLDWNDVHMDRM